jgi:hypothetical protein
VRVDDQEEVASMEGFVTPLPRELLALVLLALNFMAKFYYSLHIHGFFPSKNVED